MKTSLPRFVLAAVLCSLCLSIQPGSAQGTAFTYQGQLSSNGSAANGNYDFTFGLFNNSSTNTGQVGTTLTNLDVGVTNGLFIVALDFGSNYPGASRWLAIGVRTNGSALFTALNPLQELTPTPYAMDAANAGNLSGLVPTNLLPGFQGPYDTVGGGQGNTATTQNATVAGGASNSATAQNATVAGGDNNMASGDGAAIGGGSGNTASGVGDFIGGGGYDGTTAIGNSIQTSAAATIGGGLANNIPSGGTYNFIGGGQYNTNASPNSTICGGAYNLIQASAGSSTIGGGANNTIQIDATDTTIGGGTVNTIETNAYQSAIAGGNLNMILANAHQSAIAGGNQNVIQVNANDSAIGGGNQNSAGGQYSTVPGGYKNAAGGNYSFAAGDQAQAAFSGSFVWADAEGAAFSSTTTNQFSVRANGGVQFVTSGAGMTVDSLEIHSNIVQATGDLTLQVGTNIVVTAGSDMNASIGGTFTMTANNNVNVTATAAMDLTGDTMTVKSTSGPMTVQSSGAMITKSSTSMTLQAGTTLDVAASTTLTLSGTQLLLTGGDVGIGTNSPTQPLMMGSGAYCSTAGVWTSVSDRAAKEGFTPIKPAQVLAKVAALPITQWKYKVEHNGIKHLGPVAQDFYSSFGLGDNDKAIGTVDESGVALAAIQGLNQKLEEENAELRQQNDSLARRLNEVEAAVKALAERK
jgi:trimeric autotransporter adhesin